MDFIALDDPHFYAWNILLFMLVPMVIGMLFGKPKWINTNKLWAYRAVGVEITFVLFPFLLYTVAHLLNGSYSKFLLSPELPMAALIISGIAMSSLLKAASASKGSLPVEALLVLNVGFLSIFTCCVGLVFWLTLNDSVSEWFSVLNSLVVVISVLFSFGVSGPMNYISKYPDEFNRKS